MNFSILKKKLEKKLGGNDECGNDRYFFGKTTKKWGVGNLYLKEFFDFEKKNYEKNWATKGGNNECGNDGKGNN
jgi:hypothetical protein